MDDVRWLIAREIPYLRRCARALVGDTDLADDLVQDAVERALRKRHLWRGTGNLRSWLYRLLYNVLMNRRDRPAVERHQVPLDDGPEPVAPGRPDKTAEASDLAAALRSLPVEQRAAIVLTGLQGLSYDEAAHALDIPIGTLRSRIARGREQLRAMTESPDRRKQIRRVK